LVSTPNLSMIPQNICDIAVLSSMTSAFTENHSAGSFTCDIK
jgi:hypothetical protein